MSASANNNQSICSYDHNSSRYELSINNIGIFFILDRIMRCVQITNSICRGFRYCSIVIICRRIIRIVDIFLIFLVWGINRLAIIGRKAGIRSLFSALFSMKWWNVHFFDQAVHRLFFSIDIRRDTVVSLRCTHSQARIIWPEASFGHSEATLCIVTVLFCLILQTFYNSVYLILIYPSEAPNLIVII